MKSIASPRPSAPSGYLVIGGAAVVTAVGLSALGALAGDRRLMLLPFGAVIALGLVALALVRFELFAALVLLARASLDATKLSSSSLDTTGAVSLLFIVMSAVWLLREHRRAAAEPSPTSGLVPPLAALFAVALLSAVLSEHPLASATEAVRLGALPVIVVALGRVLRDDRHLRLLLAATLASAVLPLLVAGFQVLTGEGALVRTGVSRIQGTFQHPNPFAAYLGLVLVLAVAVRTHVRGAPKLLLTGLAVACAGALVLTYARGAWLGTVLALLVVGILQDRRILWVLAAGLVVVLVAVPSVGARLADLSQTVAPSGAPGNSLVWRFTYWREVLDLQTDPVLGIGLRGVQLSEEASQLPHNDPIRVYVELGLLGSAGYVWLLVAMAREARAALRRAPPGLPHGLAVAFAAAYASILLQMLAANIVTQLVILWYFMAIAALAMAASRHGERAPAAA
ncbi:MAG: hypothetical protein KatS3mg014_1650 [Actinomycetota bacterium]|nr:MAG: hypothetical protein KatS3mg014_1650 [Actinomycetota bacterium]